MQLNIRLLLRFLRKEMRRHNVEVKHLFKRAEASPTVSRALVRMDDATRYMTVRQYDCPNPAMSAVRGPLVTGMWFMLVLAAVALVWGALAPIESAAIAHGNVVLLSNKKTIQHLEGGIIEEILVKEGSTVQAGQPLLRLDATAARASRDALLGQYYVARATEARLIAERDGLTEVFFDKDMVEDSKRSESIAKALDAQVRLFASLQDGHRAKLSMYEQRIAQSNEKIEGLKAQIEGTTGQLEILAKEIETVQQLLNKGYATKTRLYELQRRESELKGSRGQYTAEIAKEKQTIEETEHAIVNERNEFMTKNSQDLRDAQAQIAELDEKLRASNNVVARTTINAPVGGVVTGLKTHTLGGIVEPGKPVMDIIPQDDQLVIEAHVKPTDIDTVHAGLGAQVVFTAYQMRTTPKVPGKVVQVSADSFADERNPQREPYYVAQVEVDKEFLETIGNVKLYPGMPADVLIRTGSRSFLGYLFKPITDSTHLAFRED